MINLNKSRDALFGSCFRCPLGKYLPNCVLKELHELPLRDRFKAITVLEQESVEEYMDKCLACREEHYFSRLSSH
jgi:hypothetical protein